MSDHVTCEQSYNFFNRAQHSEGQGLPTDWSAQRSIGQVWLASALRSIVKGYFSPPTNLCGLQYTPIIILQ